MWQQDDNQQMPWQNALIYCENLNLASHNDWRLPNIKELTSIYTSSGWGGIDGHFSLASAFVPGYGNYPYGDWASTTDVGQGLIGYAWVAFISWDAVGPVPKNTAVSVRCVR